MTVGRAEGENGKRYGEAGTAEPPCEGRPVVSEWIDVDDGVLLRLRQFADGWGWYAWKQVRPAGGRIEQHRLPEPVEYRDRRFDTMRAAVNFFTVAAFTSCRHEPRVLRE